MNTFKKTTLNPKIERNNSLKKLPKKGITKVLTYIVVFFLAL
jgi:hypothetical protein